MQTIENNESGCHGAPVSLEPVGAIVAARFALPGDVFRLTLVNSLVSSPH
ncbi:MAG: hypothetical protein AAF771_14290 [Pseudomonadota bacterium]